MRAYQLFPNSVASLLGYILPWFEVGLGLLLIRGVALRIGLAAAGFYLYWRPDSRFALDNQGK
ncbi:MAG: MauE/DoxX family redox-associated membrane protein [Candidatus Nanopelagicaceae bacterium]